MANLIVRNLDPEIVKALRTLAADKGCSAEAEHREILKRVLLKPKKLTFLEVLASMPNVGSDQDFEQTSNVRTRHVPS